MNLIELNEKYGHCSVKTKIEVQCNCGKIKKVSKERVRDNIEHNGEYTCMSCAITKSHALNPRGKETKEKQRQGRLGKKHNDTTKKQMTESANKKWQTPWGKKQRKIIAKRTAQGHCSNKFDKSKRKILYVSAKNNNEIRTCNSSYEYIYCENFLELDPNVLSYETQVYYKVEDRDRSLDFLITYVNGSKKVVEIKPKKRLHEEYFVRQINDSRQNALANNWDFAVVTEDELGIQKSSEATQQADEYRKKQYGLDLEKHRKEKAVERSQKHYEKHIQNDKITVHCDFCDEDHTIMKLSYDLNVEKNGRYICHKENGSINGKLPKTHLIKENPYKDLGQKQCLGPCKRILPFECFGSDKSRRDGYCDKCKECRKRK